MVSGKALLNPDAGRLPGRLRVQLFNGEDPRDEMILRIEAARRYYNLTPKDLDGLFLDIGRDWLSCGRTNALASASASLLSRR